MKAVRIHEFGGVDKLRYEEAPDPELILGHVLVRVRACAMNHLDIWVRMGWRGGELPAPHILGSDIAGEVVAVGVGVEGIPVGAKVIISPGLSCGRCLRCLAGDDNECSSYVIIGGRIGYNGGYAELVRVPAVNIISMPENLTFEEAAAIPLVFLTAWHMLVGRAHIQPGEDVLVQAAGSGVGSAAIQVAKLWGARVITTASSDEKLEKARRLGADHGINYTTVDFVEEVKKLTGGKGVEMVVDSVGAETFAKSVEALAHGGRLVTCGATANPWTKLDLRNLYLRHVSLLGSHMGRKDELLQALKFFRTGQLRPVVHQVLPLSEAAMAHQIMMDRKNFGKIVLKP
ncbi:MAG: zinc-binding dehydrogenase [Chloroflexi bacterium]|nr:zinc-binding dehydrogenase [Chloroflexota bacterium]